MTAAIFAFALATIIASVFVLVMGLFFKVRPIGSILILFLAIQVAVVIRTALRLYWG